MAIVHSAPGINLVVRRTSSYGVLVNTSIDHYGQSQPGISFAGSDNSRFIRTIGNRHYSIHLLAGRQPENLFFGGKNSLNQAGCNWQSDVNTSFSLCQTGS